MNNQSSFVGNATQTPINDSSHAAKNDDNKKSSSIRTVNSSVRSAANHNSYSAIAALQISQKRKLASGSIPTSQSSSGSNNNNITSPNKRQLTYSQIESLRKLKSSVERSNEHALNDSTLVSSTGKENSMEYGSHSHFMDVDQNSDLFSSDHSLLQVQHAVTRTNAVKGIVSATGTGYNKILSTDNIHGSPRSTTASWTSNLSKTNSSSITLELRLNTKNRNILDDSLEVKVVPFRSGCPKKCILDTSQSLASVKLFSMEWNFSAPTDGSKDNPQSITLPLSKIAKYLTLTFVGSYDFASVHRILHIGVYQLSKSSTMSPIRKISPKVINRTPVRSPDTTSPTSPGSSLRPRVINFSALPTQNNQSSPEKLQPAKKRLHYPDMYTIDFGEEIKKSVASTPPFRNHSDLDFFDNDDREAGRSFDVVNVGLKYPVRPRRNLDNAVQYPIPDEIDFEGSPQSERKPVVYQIENPNKLKPQKEQPTQAVSALWRQKRSPTKTVQVTTVKPMGFSQISKGNAYSPEKNLFETLSAKLREQEHLRNELEKIQQSFEQNANDDYTLPVSPKVRSRTPNKAEVERKKHHNSITSISSPEPLVIDTSVLGEKKPQQPQTTPKLLDSSINISINTPTPSRSMTVTNTEISIQLSDIEMEEDELMIADDFDRILNKSRESNKSIIEEEPIAPIQQQIRTSHENDLALMRQNQLEGMSVFVLRSPEKPKSRPQQSEKNSIIIIPEEVEDDIIEEKQNVISYIDNLRARELQELEIQRTEQILLLEIEKERLAKEKLEQHNELLRLHQLEIEREKEELALREQQLFEQKKKLELERVRREDALRKQIEEERLLDQQKLELERQKNLLTQQREIEEKKLEEERKDTEYQIQEERERFRLEMEKFDQMRREIEEEKEKIEEIRSIRKLEHDRFLKLQSDELERMRKERQREENLLLKQKKNLIALQDAVSPAFSRSTLALSSHSFTEVPSFSIPEPSTPLTKGEPLLTPHSIRSMMITDNVDIDQNHSPSPLSTPSPNTKDEKRRSPLRSDGHNETMSTYSPLVPQVVKHDEKAHNQSYLSNSKEVIQEHEKYVQESPIILFSPPVSNLRAMNESRLQESPYIEASLRYDSQSNSPNRSAVLVKGNWDIAHTGEPTPQKEEARFDSGVSTVEEFLNNSIDLQDMLIQPDFSDIDSINLSDADISEGEEEIALKTEPEKVVQREAYSTFGDHQVREIKTDINDTQDKKQKPSDNQQDNQLERYEIKQGEGGMTKETEFVHTQKTQSEVIQIEEKIKQEIANPSSTQPTSPLVSPMTPLTPMTPATLVKTDSPYSEVRVKEITKQNMWTINYMRRGTTFTKIHKKNNKSNNRIVKLDSTCTHLIFQKTGAALFNKTQKVAVADIQWLVYGPHTALFEKSASNCPWRCFSFITTKRSYDLMAGNDVDVDVWILGLQSLIHRRIIKWNRPLYTRGQLLFKRMKLKLQLRAWTERKPLHKVICERIAIAYNTLDQVEDQQLFVKRSSEVVGTPLKSSSQRVIMAPTTPQQTGQSTIEQLQDSPMTASKQRLERLRLDLSRLPPPQENLD